ncbi:hypothetical protein CTA2_6775 [Colletotrichum tanaceti]|uniref:Uncharacterized protein n=1 Tax=Colletotrichum tanaceti TaxID=1306861 RepID=A0A4U6XCY8_9PEZI|nr:hypothetical protein CTA2_6775 [Colletotrichum tanaceti]TKW53611.1 hypothetical protein CTA1_2737 [Colletotrichum tanaceti]
MAYTVYYFGARGFRSFFLLFLLHITLISASPNPTNVLTKRVKVEVVPKFDNDYEGRVKMGQYLRDLFLLSDEELATKNNGSSLASPFKDPAAVALNGWTENRYWYPYPRSKWRALPFYQNRLDKAFADEYFPVDKKESAIYDYWHDKTFFKDGVEKQPTMATYVSVVVPASGAFIFDTSFSPKDTKAEKEEKEGKSFGGDVPELDTLSDIAYFQWKHACEAKSVDVKNLKVIFRSHITHQGTYDIVVQALKEEKYEYVPGWDNKAVFSMDSRQGQAILGTIHGSSPAWMLIQHKKALGLKKITEVAVFSSDKGFAFENDPEGSRANLNLRFIIEDVDKGVHFNVESSEEKGWFSWFYW